MSCSKAGKHCPHQRLVVRDCPDPLSTIKSRENGPGSSRARARLKATKQRGFRLRDSGTVQVAGLLLKAATTSCLGMRTPLRRKLCHMAPQDAAMHATSCLKSSSTPADEASWCMWDKTQCQLVSPKLTTSAQVARDGALTRRSLLCNCHCEFSWGVTPTGVAQLMVSSYGVRPKLIW